MAHDPTTYRSHAAHDSTTQGAGGEATSWFDPTPSARPAARRSGVPAIPNESLGKRQPSWLLELDGDAPHAAHPELLDANADAEVLVADASYVEPETTGTIVSRALLPAGIVMVLGFGLVGAYAFFNQPAPEVETAAHDALVLDPKLLADDGGTKLERPANSLQHEGGATVRQGYSRHGGALVGGGASKQPGHATVASPREPGELPEGPSAVEGSAPQPSALVASVVPGAAVELGAGGTVSELIAGELAASELIASAEASLEVAGISAQESASEVAPDVAEERELVLAPDVAAESVPSLATARRLAGLDRSATHASIGAGLELPVELQVVMDSLETFETWPAVTAAEDVVTGQRRAAADPELDALVASLFEGGDAPAELGALEPSESIDSRSSFELLDSLVLPSYGELAEAPAGAGASPFHALHGAVPVAEGETGVAAGAESLELGGGDPVVADGSLLAPEVLGPRWWARHGRTGAGEPAAEVSGSVAVEHAPAVATEEAPAVAASEAPAGAAVDAPAVAADSAPAVAIEGAPAVAPAPEAEAWDIAGAEGAAKPLQPSPEISRLLAQPEGTPPAVGPAPADLTFDLAVTDRVELRPVAEGATVEAPASVLAEESTGAGVEAPAAPANEPVGAPAAEIAVASPEGATTAPEAVATSPVVPPTSSEALATSPELALDAPATPQPVAPQPVVPGPGEPAAVAAVDERPEGALSRPFVGPPASRDHEAELEKLIESLTAELEAPVVKLPSGGVPERGEAPATRPVDPARATSDATAASEAPSGPSPVRVATASEPEPAPKSLLRRADSDGTWRKQEVPVALIAGDEMLLTPFAGEVRLILARGEVIEGRLHAVGLGKVEIDSKSGRMRLEGGAVQRIENLASGPAASKAPGKGASDTTGLEEVRVRTRGDWFTGHLVTREGDRVTLILKGGQRMTVEALEVEAVGMNRAKVSVKRPEAHSQGN